MCHDLAGPVEVQELPAFGGRGWEHDQLIASGESIGQRLVVGLLGQGTGWNEQELIETIKYRNPKGIWYVRLAMLMPDHVHLVVWFPEVEKRMQTIISKWKEWTAKALKIQ